MPCQFELSVNSAAPSLHDVTSALSHGHVESAPWIRFSKWCWWQDHYVADFFYVKIRHQHQCNFQSWRHSHVTLKSQFENLPGDQLQLRLKYRHRHQQQANKHQYLQFDMVSRRMHQYAHHRSIESNQSRKYLIIQESTEKMAAACNLMQVTRLISVSTIS